MKPTIFSFLIRRPSLGDIIVLALAVMLAGCGTTDTNDRVSSVGARPQAEAPQPVLKLLETYVGGPIFKVDHTKPLPNLFGKPDIFGRKVYAGYTELRYQGMTDDGRLLLRVTEAETYSTETTMSRSGQSSVNAHVDQWGNVSGTVTRPPQGNTSLLPPNTTEFAFDPSKDKELVMAGMRVRFLDFKPQSLRYSLEKQ